MTNSTTDNYLLTTACDIVIHDTWMMPMMPVCCSIKPPKYTFSLSWPHLFESLTSLTKLKKQQTDYYRLQLRGIISTCVIAWIGRPEMAGSTFRCYCITLCFLAACNLVDAIAPLHLPADGESFIEMGHAMPLVTAGHGMSKQYPSYWSYCFHFIWS